MISDYLQVINSYIDKPYITLKIYVDEVEDKTRHLGVILSKPLIEFYTYFCNNEKVLNLYYEFKKIEDLELVKDALIFGFCHQRQSTLGILISDLEKANPPIKKAVPSREKWYSECISSSKFFVNIACYSRESEKLFVSSCDDLYLNEFEEKSGLDLDWL